MFQIKLKALEHPSPDTVNTEDPLQYRNIILWLEDQKIRHYKIDDRVGLRKVDNLQEWEESYKKYKNDVKCPKELKTQSEELCWLLGYATRLEYFDNVAKYKLITASKVLEEKKPNVPSVKSTNPFDNFDFHSKDFESGVRNLASLLHIPYHPDHLVSLMAISRVVKQNLSNDALKEQIIEGTPYPFQEISNMGHDDVDIEKGAKILRLLQTQSMRQLQTGINETIVAIQNFTADPKTDTKLGKVGH